MFIIRLLFLLIIVISLIFVFQTGCDELITEQIFITEAGHPTAEFNVDNDSGCAPLTVKFSDLSNGPRDQYIWNYGDGVVDTFFDSVSTPTHTYDIAGTYTVILTIKDSDTDGNDVEVKTRFIIVDQSIAGFSALPDSGCSGIEVTFTPANYGGISSWLWDFGDGNSSTDSTPVHVYDSLGIFDVTLSITGDCGSTVLTDTGLIKITNCPTVFFTADSSSGCVPFTTTFHDASIPGAGETITQGSQQWNFGNGQIADNPQNPTVTYSNPGQYTVRLSVGSTGGTATDSIVDFITVHDSTAAIFSVVGNSKGCKSDFQQFQVKFISTSTGSIDSLVWDFGDSIILNTTDTEVVHAYINTGIFDVYLNVYSPCGNDDTLMTNLVVLSDSLFDSTTSFTITPPTGDTSTIFSFVDQSSGIINSLTWNFGDGLLDAGSSVTHSYDSIGTYEVQLTINNSCGSAIAVDTIIVIAK